MVMDWNELYELAKSKRGSRILSKHSEAGSVAAAILSEQGHVYCGVCIDTPCSLGFCAEHAAIAAMVTAGENRILRMVAVGANDRVIPPCGRCREFICQVHDDNYRCEVLLDGGRVSTIGDLLPERW